MYLAENKRLALAPVTSEAAGSMVWDLHHPTIGPTNDTDLSAPIGAESKTRECTYQLRSLIESLKKMAGAWDQFRAYNTRTRKTRNPAARLCH
jgi:hypothetical protein